MFEAGLLGRGGAGVVSRMKGFYIPNVKLFHSTELKRSERVRACPTPERSHDEKSFNEVPEVGFKNRSTRLVFVPTHPHLNERRSVMEPQGGL